MSNLELPAAPSHLQGPVKAWSQAVNIDTYQPHAPDLNPMFLEKRVYQGSSGRVYPLPFIDRISEEKTPRSWQALHLENRFIRLMVLPEIGGRIHVGLDKTNGYDFFYRQNVIKPALVGLAGPWISGGVEFNWPQHHRPATFMGVHWEIEESPDGSRTLWCSDHDPMNRLKGMHGVCLHPDKAYVELKVRLYNRTCITQSFLWWANVATRVHERYQSFFPQDVTYIADHAKRAMSRYPFCQDHYYGVDYARRATQGVPADQAPRCFKPTDEYAPNDLSWYANIPVPTSYMCMGSSDDFFGGYDHQRQAGLVHVANHHISPGKKQWTWGNHEFGYAWDRHLTDQDGPYIELMAGVYTDNQPDFAFLAPGETKTFSQYWYPIQQIGTAQKANLHAAASLQRRENRLRVGISPAEVIENARVVLKSSGKEIFSWQGTLSPGTPLIKELLWSAPETELSLQLFDASGCELLGYQPQARKDTAIPEAASEPAMPAQIASTDELYITGLHLEQYRHATRMAEDYWREALRRDPLDSRCNNAMGIWHFKRGEFPQAEAHFRRAIERLTRRNPNPADGESYYHLGLTLRFLRRDAEAYDAFYKATWNQAWHAAGFLALAEIDAAAGDWALALEHLRQSLRMNSDQLKARNLQAIALTMLGQSDAAQRLVKETLALDPLDLWAQWLSGRNPAMDNQERLDLALDLARAGQWNAALEILQGADLNLRDGSVPMVLYTQAYLENRRGDNAAAADLRRQAALAAPDYCFPARLEELVMLQKVIAAEPTDSRAPYYLGNLLYDRRRHPEAIAAWEKAVTLEASNAVAWRNLGIGYFNILGQSEKARGAFDRALAANPDDARILFERDQLLKRTGESPRRRLEELLKRPALVARRDDLTVELATLYNQTGNHEAAEKILAHRRFQPWEGGEGQALGQYLRTQMALGRAAFKRGAFDKAMACFQAALQSPENLGEAKHLLANQSDIHFWLGEAALALHDPVAAAGFWDQAATTRGDFQEMAVKSFSEMTYYNVRALQRLGHAEQARELLTQLRGYALELSEAPAKIDYFATSLPNMLLFAEDLPRRNRISAAFLTAQATMAEGHKFEACAQLEGILALDSNHAMAADLLAEITEESLC